MLDHYPMARVTPLDGGNITVYDLGALRTRVAAMPQYPQENRDIVTIQRKVRRKTYGVRPVGRLAFEIPFDRSDNALACWLELSGNQIAAPFDFSSASWTQQNASIVLDDVDSPGGVKSATRLIDASGGAQGLIFTRAISSGPLFSHQTKTALFTLFARADVPHVARIDIRANASPDLVVVQDFWAGVEWRRVTVRNTFDVTLTTNRSSWAFISPSPNGTGEIHAWAPDMREISPRPGRDAEILEDLIAKASQDAYRVELSLDGGLTFRDMNLEPPEIALLKNKYIGHRYDLTFTATELIPARPSTLDGRW